MPRETTALNFTANASRRSFLLTGVSLAATPLWGIPAIAASGRKVSFSDHPFKLGIASGDPDDEGFVIWTRLAPRPLEGGGMPDENVPVSWQVAADEKMTKVVAKGEAIARKELAHSVHVEVTRLEPDRWYFYQFKAGSEISPVGRSRTTPRQSAVPERFRFAFASCQHYEHGLYTAYEHMAESDLDLVVHLGDYIYEYGGVDGKVRKHQGGEINSLDEYRNRYAQYKSDPHLQAAHARFPWLVTWDDHEFDNNYADRISEEKGVAVEDFLKRRARAYQAYYEHMPLRRTSVPRGPDMQLYRRSRFGKLLEFSVLDTRQYRTDQPCGDRNKPPCRGTVDPQATLLGRRQESWLLRGLSRSRARWNVLAQQVMMARADVGPGPITLYSMDQWPGYEVNRQRILEFLRDRNIANPVVLTGDIHKNWVNNLQLNERDADDAVVATEFVTTSISSGGNGSRKARNTDGILAKNPFVKFHNAERGYVGCTVTPEEWRSDYLVVPYVDRPGAPQVKRASFVVESGKAGAEAG